MKRWMTVMVLSVLLVLSGSVFAAGPAGDADQDNLLSPVFELGRGDLIGPGDAGSDDDSNGDGGDGWVTPNGALWPKGVW